MPRSSRLQLFFLLASISCSAAVETGRWRYGSISWSRDAPDSRRVIISVESGWRLSHSSILVSGTQDPVSAVGQVFKVLASDGQDPLLEYGDSNITARFDVEVVRIDPAQDLVVGKSEFVWDYVSDGPFTAELTLCCRVAENQNANNRVKIATVVDLTGNSLGSPVVAMMPRIHLDGSMDTMQSFLVPAAAQAEDGSSLAWSIFNDYWTPQEPQLFGIEPNSTYIDGLDVATGVLTVDVGMHNMGSGEDLQMLVVVSQGSARSMVDFLVRVQPPAGSVPTLTITAPPSPHPLAGQSTTQLRGLPTVTAFEGFEVSLSVRGADADIFNSVFFEYNSLPSNLVLEPRFENNPSTQRLRWTPTAAQVGRHNLCAAAMDADPASPCSPCTPAPGEASCVPACPAQLRSVPLCFLVDVQSNNAPLFALPAPADRHYRIEMNEVLSVVVSAVDDNWVDAVTLKPDGTHPQGSSIIPTPGNPGQATFSWRPGPAFGGLDQDVCFVASDSGVGGTQQVKASTMCFRVEVYACRWSVAPGDTLSGIAAQFGSNYVQMWSLNPGLESPDESLQAGDSVNVGHLYKVRDTDNLRYLAVQFATTRATLELLNFNTIEKTWGDKDRLTALAGSYICILPHSCFGYEADVA
mmetsp:Transcript_23679/g.56633  ORF Transcript_23679/g.56633 Transcript_23679/m.56633 type:complete len:637 (-) Transcript_23679:189-2099(-)